MGEPIATPGRAARQADLLSLGFGTTFAMWLAGYVLRLPPARTPSEFVLALMIFIMLAGGWFSGRLTPRGWRGGLLAGLLSSLLNLLILGSLLADHGQGQVVPSALLWVPGSLLVGGLVGAAGASLGARGRPPAAAPARNWTAVFASVAAAATVCLLTIGGIVTGKQAGLSVVDWPNSFGHNMFLFPLSRMTGGVYFEHAHRLFGSLVGLATLVLALHLQRADARPAVRRFALGALGLVVVQGILGGLRVTGRFTGSADPAQTAPRLDLAIVHGVTGQLFFCSLVALAALTTSTWRSDRAPVAAPRAATDQALSRLLVPLLIVQLVLGAVLRHLSGGLVVHVSFAVVVVTAATMVGVRAWSGYAALPIVPRLGRSLLTHTALQVVLGVGALGARAAREFNPDRTTLDVIVTTAHQINGAWLLGLATLLALWLGRLTRPERPATVTS